MKRHNKVAIILHLYHTDLWPELQSLLLNFSKDIKLYLSLNIKDKNNTDLINQINSNFLTFITYHDNFGADVAPFVDQICEIDEPYFIKIHSKKSTLGNKNQINWRNVLLHSLLGSKNIFKKNLTLIKKSNIGCVGNKNLLMRWENTNSKKIKKLCNILKINYNNINDKAFFAGNMFMGRTEIFKKYLQPHKENLIDLLKTETNKVDDNKYGTFTHSLERIFGYIIPYSNLEFGFTELPYIRIKNSLAPDGYFHMINLYNKDCYIKEDMNLYGSVLGKTDKNMIIEWKHKNPTHIQSYKLISKNTIIKN
jgi:lipopolysaccharide biosynthesis protein